MKVDQLFLRKLLVAFVVGAVGSILQKITTVGPLAAFSWTHAVWASALNGAVLAGVRAAFVLLPGVNLVPSDALSPLAKAKVPAAKRKPTGTPKPR